MLTAGNTIWAMDHDKLLALCAGAGRMQWPTSKQIAKLESAQAKALRAVKGKVAVLPLYGVVEQRMSGWGYLFGGASTEMLGNALDAALNARDVEAVVLDVDSPGGSVYGTQELSDQIYSARGSKPIVAVANSMAASAAYWIATAADQLVVTPGGDVGSVGVYSMHVDYTEALANEGIKVSIIKAGKYKAEGNPYEPMSDEAKDYMQQSVNDTYTQFVKSVARNRGASVTDVRANFGQGRCVGAESALDCKMVDRVATLGQVLGKLTGSSAAGSRAASVQILRMRHEHRKQVTEGVL